jgi:ABC-2 type transport system ATP-binding protein
VDCPTEHFKESLRKVVLEFPGTPPAFPACQGLVSNRQIGRKLEAVIVGFNDEHLRLAESLKPRSVEIIELNLEDAFIDYTRGPRRALPIFSGEPSDAQSAGV